MNMAMTEHYKKLSEVEIIQCLETLCYNFKSTLRVICTMLERFLCYHVTFVSFIHHVRVGVAQHIT